MQNTHLSNFTKTRVQEAWKQCLIPLKIAVITAYLVKRKEFSFVKLRKLLFFNCRWWKFFVDLVSNNGLESEKNELDHAYSQKIKM